MKIISLISENIKRLKAVEIKPDGKSLTVCGQNEAGKSSVLDSIWYVLAGKGVVCERPIRDGESAARTELDLGDYLVTRTYTAAGGGSLKVIPKGSKAVGSPQNLLDSLIGDLTFDPLAFSREKDQEQAAVLRRLVGLDFAAMDKERQETYDRRHLVGQEVTILKGKLAREAFVEGVPAEEVDVTAALAEKNKIVEQNTANATRRVHFDTLRSEYTKALGEVTDLQVKLNAAIERRDNFSRALSEKDTNPVPSDQSTGEQDRQITEAGEINKRVAANRRYRELQASLENHEAAYIGDTARIDELDAERQAKLAATKFPLPGLSFSSSGSVVFNGVPFSQSSSAQRLKVSAAIAMALNPTVRVMLIRDGSLLDGDSLTVLKELAEGNDFQLWIEKVGGLTNELPGVLIEDGMVVQNTL